MKFVHKSLGLLLASLALASCGGGGGDSNSFTSPPQPGSITLTPAGNSTVLPLNVNGASPYFVGSPYANEVDIHWTNADGSPVSECTWILPQFTADSSSGVLASSSTLIEMMLRLVTLHERSWPETGDPSAFVQ